MAELSAEIQKLPRLKTLTAPPGSEMPMLIVNERVALQCGCCYWIGRRSDTGEGATAAERCGVEHKALIVEANRLLLASLEHPTGRPLADVLAGVLESAAAGEGALPAVDGQR